MPIFWRGAKWRGAARGSGGKALGVFVLCGALLLYASALFKNVCFVAGGADSSGYANSARLLARGEIFQEVPELNELRLSDEFIHAFVPLGFVPGPRPRTLVPSYPPGVPLHMAAAAQLGGWSRAPFYVSPVAALLCLFLLYALSREFQLSVASSLAAPIILGLCPTFVFQAIQPMSDTLATCWCLLTIFCCLRSHKTSWVAAAAGAAFGVAVLVRPTNLLLLAPLLFALPLKAKHLLYLVGGGLPFAVFLLWYNSIAYGEATRTGYGSLIEGGMLAWSNFPVRFRHYTYEIFLQLSPFVALAWTASPFVCRVPLRRRLVLLVWPIAYFAFYVFYFPYETWWYLRFLLPCLPAIIVGALLVWEELARKAAWLGTPVVRVAGATLLLCVVAMQLYQVSDYDVFLTDENQSGEYAETAAQAQRLLPEQAFVLCMQTSGALHYYTDFHIVRWDMLNEQQNSLLLQRVAESGAPMYALLFPFEVEEAQRRMRWDWHKMADFRGITLWRVEGRRQEADGRR